MMENWEYQEAMEAARSKGVVVDESKGVEVQTDKKAIKVVACVGCARALVVSSFYVPANARCAECKDGQETGTVNAPVPGKTDPAKVEDLSAALVNPTFARALCPVHPDDEEHQMELKQITHSPHYGPSELIGYSGGGLPEYRQLATGETALLQCLRCRATVTYSTTAQSQLRRQNEARESNGRGAESNVDTLGAREEEQ